jgi:hypothetical protein
MADGYTAVQPVAKLFLSQRRDKDHIPEFQGLVCLPDGACNFYLDNSPDAHILLFNKFGLFLHAHFNIIEQETFFELDHCLLQRIA